MEFDLILREMIISVGSILSGPVGLFIIALSVFIYLDKTIRRIFGSVTYSQPPADLNWLADWGRAGWRIITLTNLRAGWFNQVTRQRLTYVPDRRPVDGRGLLGEVLALVVGVVAVVWGWL